MGTLSNHLFVISFTAGSEAGLAIVSACDERMAIQLLRNSGKYNFLPKCYTIKQTRDIGLTSTIRMELLMESYVDALVAYDAIVKALQNAPAGRPGESAYEVAVRNGFSGTEKEWLDSLVGKCDCDGHGHGGSGLIAYVEGTTLYIISENARVINQTLYL